MNITTIIHRISNGITIMNSGNITLIIIIIMFDVDIIHAATNVGSRNIMYMI